MQGNEHCTGSEGIPKLREFPNLGKNLLGEEEEEVIPALNNPRGDKSQTQQPTGNVGKDLGKGYSIGSEGIPNSLEKFWPSQLGQEEEEGDFPTLNNPGGINTKPQNPQEM